MFFAIIAIAIILISFVLLSSVWKVFSEVPVGSISFDKEGEEESFFEYMNGSYEDLAEVRFEVAREESIEDAIEEVGYEE